MQLDPKTVHAPDFGQIWLNSPPLSLPALRGRVVLVDFWDYTCINCIRTLPYLREWHRRYAAQGLIIVGVHTPEFYFAHVPELVQLAVKDLGIEYPVLLDNDYTVWQAFANRYWPSKYLIDIEGYIRYFHHGEGNYGDTETAIQALLRERDPQAELPPVMKPLRKLDEPGAIQACRRPTPELYFGAKRERIANLGGIKENEAYSYQYAPTVQDGIELNGLWTVRSDSAQAGADPVSELRFEYSAAEVNLVMASGADCPIARLEILENGRPLSRSAWGSDVSLDPATGAAFVAVLRPRMYSLIRRNTYTTGLLQLSTKSKGLELFALTFVSCI